MDSFAGEVPSGHRPTYLEIDLGALGRNYVSIRERVGDRRIWCVVKADAYGHGASACAGTLQRVGADAFAVATVDEGVELREVGVGGEILVMAGIAPLPGRGSGGDPDSAASLAVRHGLAVAVWDAATAAELRQAALAAGVEASVQLKVDTGMGRLGVPMEDSVDAALAMAEQLSAMEGIALTGVFSNLASSDAPLGEGGHDHTALQIERFAQLCAVLDDAGILPEHRHLANSGAVTQHESSFTASWCTGVRPGLALFGASLAGAGEESALVELEPVMSWHSAVAAVRRVSRGWPLGYGARRRAESDSEIAIVPVGYHDGWPRSLSDRGEVLIGGQRAKVVGAISMDLTLVDITGIPGIRVGDPVVLLGAAESGGAASEIRVEEVAERAATIAHEILSRVGQRLPRRFVGIS